jgi:hypothetical protein
MAPTSSPNNHVCVCILFIALVLWPRNQVREEIMMMMEMDALLVWVEHHHHVGWNDHWPSIYPNWYPLDTRLNQDFKCIDTWYQSKRKATSSSWSTSNLCAWNLKNTHFVPYSYVWIPVNGLVRLMSSWARHEGTDLSLDFTLNHWQYNW